jgi:hypothetical protein
MNGIDLRLHAKEFAKECIKKLRPPMADAPYLEAVLVECALFEEPMKDLVIALNGVGTFYTITVKGYQNLISLVRWVNTFLGQNRNPMLCHVTDTFVQTNDKCVIMVIQMNKVEFTQATDPTPASERTTKFKKRVE